MGLRIVAALDSFKGSLSSEDAGRAVARGMAQADPGFSVTPVCIADGGEGSLEAVHRAAGGTLKNVAATDPLGRPCTAECLLLPDGETALVELAKTSGLTLLAAAEQNPFETTTGGTGQVIRQAITDGARRIVLAVGGSATNDGGMGIGRALGVAYLDGEGREVPPTGGGLKRVARIDRSGVAGVMPRSVAIEVATDVQNPLCGPEGAAQVYARQKGADDAMVEALDAGLENLAAVIKATGGPDVTTLPGAGAAGGVAATLVGLFNAKIVPGFDVLSRLAGLPGRVAEADLVITGEGRVDGQTLNGKVPFGVATLARKAGVPVWVVGGSITEDAEALREAGVSGFFPIVQGPMTLAAAMENAEALLETTARRMGYLLKAFRF